MASALTFPEQYHKDGKEFLSYNVKGDETWVSFVNVETEEQSKQWMHTHSPDKLKQFKEMSACRKADGICFLRQVRSADVGINATMDHNVRSVL
jgi:hypothetical protein